MKLDEKKLKGNTFSISGFSKKFRIAKSKSTVKGTLEASGATVDKKGGKCLIGRETENFMTAFTNADYVFEGELEDRSYQDNFQYFKDIDLKFYDMMRKLLATDNIRFSFIRIGVPVTEAEFEKLEKKLKRPIPAAVKEFYSIFGEIRVLWDSRNPYKKTGVTAGSKSWSLDYHDNHTGAFQILPLKTVLFEKWDKEEYCFDVGTDLKIFDPSSDYHMVALDITSEGNPMVYRGEDHGVQFRESAPFSFTDYINLTIGLYGTRERFSYFQMTDFNSAHNKSEAEIKAAITGKAAVDINNDAYLLPAIKEITTVVDAAIEQGDYDAALNKVLDLHNLRYSLFIDYKIDLARLKGEAADFAKSIFYYAKDAGFDWEAYEKEHAQNSIFEDKEYLKAKKKYLKSIA